MDESTHDIVEIIIFYPVDGCKTLLMRCRQCVVDCPRAKSANGGVKCFLVIAKRVGSLSKHDKQPQSRRSLNLSPVSIRTTALSNIVRQVLQTLPHLKRWKTTSCALSRELVSKDIDS